LHCPSYGITERACHGAVSELTAAEDGGCAADGGGGGGADDDVVVCDLIDVRRCNGREPRRQEAGLEVAALSNAGDAARGAISRNSGKIVQLCGSEPGEDGADEDTS